MVEMQAGSVPKVGQVVYLAWEASPQFRNRPIRLLVTHPVQPSSLDALQRRDVESATWLLLTGWELGARGERVLHRTVTARREGVSVFPIPEQRTSVTDEATNHGEQSD